MPAEFKCGKLNMPIWKMEN